MISQIPNTTPLQPRRYLVRFKDGSVWAMTAMTFRRVVNPDDTVKIYLTDNLEHEDGFIRSEELTAIAPDADPHLTPPVLALQEEVKTLTSRLLALENNMAQTIKRAVKEAVKQAVKEAFDERKIASLLVHLLNGGIVVKYLLADLVVFYG